MNIQIADVSVEIFYKEEPDDQTPIVLLHVFENEGESVWEECLNSGVKNFCLAVIKADKWTQMLSPWKAEKVFRDGSDFGDGADVYIEKLETVILPEIRKMLNCHRAPCYITGYSFAGLFSLYSLYKTDVFVGAASVSGSLWFPDFAEFVLSHEMKKQPEKLYFSLGDREHRTKQVLMKQVNEKTKMVYEHVRAQGMDCVFEQNPGGHFQDVEKRMARGICWIMKEH